MSSNNNSVPRWNLDSIFPSLESEEYKKAFADYENAIVNLDALLNVGDDYTKKQNDHYDFADWLATYLNTYNRCLSLQGTLVAYAYVLYSTDTTNPSYLNNLDKIINMQGTASVQRLKFAYLVLAHQTSLEDFYRRYPAFSEYKYILQELVDETKHSMSPAEEKLAADLNGTGGEAWGQLQEQLISNLTSETGRTFNEIRNDAFSSDSKVRKDAWTTERSLLKQNRIAFAASLANLKGQTIFLNGKRHWENAIDRSLVSSRMSKETLAALISSMEDALPMWRKYFQAKAKYLRNKNLTASDTAGTKGHEGLAFYDLFAPLSSVSKTYSFEEAKDYVLKEYRSFSEDMYLFAKSAFDNQWIDAQIRPGKVGGAYDEDFPLGHQSRILTNFSGDIGGIITLAHELGHAYHFYCMKSKEPLLFSYPMTLAETASTFAETIVKQDLIAGASKEEKLGLLDLDLQDAAQVLVDILCRYYFEQSVFEEMKNTKLNADDFCRLMQKAQERSYGSGLNEERHDYMWAVKSHYYSTGLDFYNFPYAFGQLFAAGLYERSKKEGAEFANTYKMLLSRTGSMSCEDLCSKAGFDIRGKDFWKSGLAMYEKEIEEFVALVS